MPRAFAFFCPVGCVPPSTDAEAAGADSIQWHEGDVEVLPFPDSQFDAVLSSVGHMFAPRPEAAIAEMLRALKSGGRIAFMTWPPELAVGRMLRRGPMQRQLMRNLKIYKGGTHPHEAQQPEIIDVKSLNRKNARA